ncbi:MAG: TolC family protein [Deltaproteobacteria bacterium]|nr:TolC family protein [Deltaproteobacteria bacterium]
MSKIIKAILLSLCLINLSYSEETPAPQPAVTLKRMTLEDAVELAVANSVEIRKAAVSIRDYETKLSEETVWNWLQPNLSLKGGFDTETFEPRVGLGIGIDLRDVMGRGKKRRRTLNYSVEEGRKSLDSLKAAIRIKVTAGYKEYNLSKKKLKGIQETLKTDEALLKAAEDTGSNLERLLTRSMVNQDRLALITAQLELSRVETSLRELLGLTPVTTQEDIDNIQMDFREILENSPSGK